MATRTILLDIGGTFIKCSDGREIPIDSAGSREEIVSSLRQSVEGYDSASVAIPGPFRDIPDEAQVRLGLWGKVSESRWA